MKMPHGALNSRHSIDCCTFQLHTWKPFANLTKPNPNHPHHPKTLDSDSYNSNPKPTTTVGIQTKRPCLSDRATSFSLSIDSIDLSKLSLFEDDKPFTAPAHKTERFSWIARKRRRRGSRSVSGRSSDRSGTRNGQCCSLGATATATCSDFMVAAGGTDSSGELFGSASGNGNGNGNGNGSGDANWGSDVGDARNSRREKGEGGVGIGERESSGSGLGCDAQWSESGYGSEPGYRGDAELGYGDEVDEEEDDARLLFWGDKFGAAIILAPLIELLTPGGCLPTLGMFWARATMTCSQVVPSYIHPLEGWFISNQGKGCFDRWIKINQFTN
ncbi:hypothetical protein Ancab_019563 [Ancistrocladus abbreviatus]